jgi:hypothetical protein
MKIRLLVLLLGLGLALIPSSALAATTYTESVNGIETGLPQSTRACPATSSVSPFAGIATGTIIGTFQIAVCHTQLTTKGATIKSGAFTISNGTTTVNGAFKYGGKIFPPSLSLSGAFCIQKYKVTGGLWPAGNFAGKLTHYGIWTGSACNVFFATISGSATLTA